MTAGVSRHTGVRAPRSNGSERVRPMRTRVPLWLIACALAIFSASLCLVLDQLSWQFRFSLEGYTTALNALASALTAIVSSIAAVGVFMYVMLTYKLWEESRRTNEQAQRTNEAALMSQLMLEYDSLSDATRVIEEYYRSFREKDRALSEFRNAHVASDFSSNVIRNVDSSRFRLSRFFVRVHRLSVARFLSRTIILAALGPAAIEDVFLDKVFPLDEVIARLAPNTASAADRAFFQDLVSPHASDVSALDFVGHRQL